MISEQDIKQVVDGDTVLIRLPDKNSLPDKNISAILMKRNIQIIWVPYNYEFIVVRKTDDR